MRMPFCNKSIVTGPAPQHKRHLRIVSTLPRGCLLYAGPIWAAVAFYLEEPNFRIHIHLGLGFTCWSQAPCNCQRLSSCRQRLVPHSSVTDTTLKSRSYLQLPMRNKKAFAGHLHQHTQFLQTLKGSDDGLQNSELPGSWALSIIWHHPRDWSWLLQQ
jgi:hypothetical protein